MKITKRPPGRPRVLPNRWKANVALRSMGLTQVEVGILLGIDVRVADRNFKRDAERFLPELISKMRRAYAKLALKKDVSLQEG